MARADFPRSFKQHSLLWALGLSVMAHALLVLWLHPFEFERQSAKPPLTVELVRQEPPPLPAPPVVPPEPPPEPEPPKPLPKPEPVKRPAPPKPSEQPAPSRVEETTAPPEPPRQPSAPPPVITAAPEPEEVPPTFTAPPPPPAEPPKPVGPSEADLDQARQSYGNALSREIGKYKRYPRIAQMRGWQSTVTLMLEIDASGKVVSVRIEEPSDRDVFNTEAEEMVKRMVQPPPIPEALRGRSFNVRVPIAFRLE